MLSGVARHLQPLGARRLERFGRPRAEDESESERPQAILQPAEVVALPVRAKLVCLSRDVEAIDDPRVVALEFDQPRPRAVRLESQSFLLWREIGEAASPRQRTAGQFSYLCLWYCFLASALLCCAIFVSLEARTCKEQQYVSL
jgi:hypothetical protein